MAISVVIHLGFLMAVEWLLSDKADASISNSVLLVIIQPPEAQEGFSANEEHVAAAATSEAAIPERIQEAAGASDQQAKVVDAADTTVAAETSPNNLKSATAAASSEKQAAVDREQVADDIDVASLREDTVVAPSDVVTTVALTEPAVSGRASKTARPASVQAPLSPKQENNLQRKNTAWNENLHNLPEAPAGMTWRYSGQ